MVSASKALPEPRAPGARVAQTIFSTAHTEQETEVLALQEALVAAADKAAQEDPVANSFCVGRLHHSEVKLSFSRPAARGGTVVTEDLAVLVGRAVKVEAVRRIVGVVMEADPGQRAVMDGMGIPELKVTQARFSQSKHAFSFASAWLLTHGATPIRFLFVAQAHCFPLASDPGRLRYRCLQLTLAHVSHFHLIVSTAGQGRTREKGAEAPSDSEKSFFSHAQNFAAGNDQMVKHPYFDELQCIAQPASD